MYAYCRTLPVIKFKDVRANCFCASLLRTQIHAMLCIERALSYKINDDMADGHCLPGFNDLGRSVNPVFILMDHFRYRFSTFSDKMKKIYRLQNAPAVSNAS